MENTGQCEATKLADIIKETHRSLRVQCEDDSSERVWSSHVSNSDKLQLYSQAMHSLATLHWQHSVKNKKTCCRINWIYDAILEYEKEIKVKSREKEERKLKFFIEKNLLPSSVGEQSLLPSSVVEQNLLPSSGGEQSPLPSSVVEQNLLPSSGGKKTSEAPIKSSSPLTVLDVGSCYNPFKDYKEFDVTAIDLAPATKDVLQCDFLTVPITENDAVTEDGAVSSLRSESYDAVVFCLLLEYLPTPQLRLECCKRAYKLLKTEGVLVIVTPDSKHNNCNTLLYQLWKASLSSLGFTRVKYEKEEHFHGMLFRKSCNKELSLLSSQEMFEEIRKKVTKPTNEKVSKRKVRLKSIDIDLAKSGLLIPQDLPAAKQEKTPKRKIDEIS